MLFLSWPCYFSPLLGLAFPFLPPDFPRLSQMTWLSPYLSTHLYLIFPHYPLSVYSIYLPISPVLCCVFAVSLWTLIFNSLHSHLNLFILSSTFGSKAWNYWTVPCVLLICLFLTPVCLLTLVNHCFPSYLTVTDCFCTQYTQYTIPLYQPAFCICI